MPGDWIKMRGLLLQHPKVARIARVLHESRKFREWLTPGGGGPMNVTTVSDEASRCVVTALLLRVWSCARAVGKFVGDDLTISHIGEADVDAMAGVDGFAGAMIAVDWLRVDESQGVVFPGFTANNAPMTDAERQAKKRDKVRHETSRGDRDGLSRNVTPREEKRREEKKGTEDSSLNPPPPFDSQEWDFAWTEWIGYRKERGLPAYRPRTLSAMFAKFNGWGESRSIQALRQSIENAWQGIFEPKEFGNGKQRDASARRTGRTAREFPEDAISIPTVR